MRVPSGFRGLAHLQLAQVQQREAKAPEYLQFRSGEEIVENEIIPIRHRMHIVSEESLRLVVQVDAQLQVVQAPGTRKSGQPVVLATQVGRGQQPLKAAGDFLILRISLIFTMMTASEGSPPTAPSLRSCGAGAPSWSVPSVWKGGPGP